MDAQSISIEELKTSVYNILTVNMNLKPGERVLIVSDVPRPEDWQNSYTRLEELLQRALLARQIADIARSLFCDNPVDFITYPTTGQNGTEPPEWVAERMSASDVVLIPNTFSITHTNARTGCCARGARVASMPGIETDMFMAGRPMQADYYLIRNECEEWAARLTSGNQVRVTTSKGTDLTFSIAGRAGRVDNGLFHNRGDWGNLPAGEAYIAPIEGTANGKLVAPAGWYPRLTEDFILTFEAGYLISAVGGGGAGDELRDAFHLGDDSFRHRRNCAEFGIGKNHFASRATTFWKRKRSVGPFTSRSATALTWAERTNRTCTKISSFLNRLSSLTKVLPR